jgi:hypothetical protein
METPQTPVHPLPYDNEPERELIIDPETGEGEWRDIPTADPELLPTPGEQVAPPADTPLKSVEDSPRNGGA